MEVYKQWGAQVIRRTQKLEGKLREFFPYLGFLILFLLFSLTTEGRFFTLSNLRLVVKQSAVVLVGTLGATFVMAHGNLDFSLGGELALCALAGWYAAQIHPLLLLPACILAGAVLSFIIAKAHTALGVPVFTAGMCVMFIGKGVLQAIGPSQVMTCPELYSGLDEVNFYIICAVILTGIAYVLFDYTKLGRYNRMIGVNERASAFSGISVARYKELAFLLTGVSVGIAAFLTIVRSGGVSAQTGGTYEIDVLLALVLGGVSLSGGSGVRIRNGVLGALTYYMLNNGLTLWGISAEIIYVIKGLLFLLIVSFSYDRKNGKEIF